MVQLNKSHKPASGKDSLVLISSSTQLKELELDRLTRSDLSTQLEASARVAYCEADGRSVLVHLVNKNESLHLQMERARKAAGEMVDRLNALCTTEAQLLDLQSEPALALALAEGLCLANYRFQRYKSEPKAATFQRLAVVSEGVLAAALEEVEDVAQATCDARDLVNEPHSFLTAVQFSAEIKNLGKNSGIKVTVLNKAQIEAQGMGGLLGVNKGSQDPPTFNILEYKPRGAVNKAPYVLIGKGVVFDTGGLSLKPTPNSMDHMKCDMAGAAAVICALGAIAKRELPVYVVGLVPATDNRPGERAICPGDVLRMHNGLTVEVLNTDAEGRLILADALSFAERYAPKLVVDCATLTGAAARAIGSYGVVAMGTASESDFDTLTKAGEECYERIARMPFWEEYGEEMESDIADLKNLGSDLAGHITAGKFLARFTTRPYIHLDIAGVAFNHKREPYKPKGGTGTGVRLLYSFIKQLAQTGNDR
jgi:leucyl aminopeptidase